MTPQEHAEVAWSLYRTGGDPSPDELGAHQNFVAGYVRGFDAAKAVLNLPTIESPAQDEFWLVLDSDGDIVTLSHSEADAYAECKGMDPERPRSVQGPLYSVPRDPFVWALLDGGRFVKAGTKGDVEFTRNIWTKQCQGGPYTVEPLAIVSRRRS